MTDQYTDPTNTADLLAQLKKCKTLKEVKDFIDTLFPSWFITVMDKYSADYPYLTTNWDNLCKEMGANNVRDAVLAAGGSKDDAAKAAAKAPAVKKAQIIIVDDLGMEDNQHTLIKHFAECFTRMGFVVRSKKEYVPCDKCGCAIPSPYMWTVLKGGMDIPNIPEEWKPVCRDC